MKALSLPREATYGDFRPRAYDLSAFAKATNSQIFTDQTGMGGLCFDKNGLRGSLAQGLDSDCATAGEEIEKTRVWQTRRQNIEKGLFDAAQGGTLALGGL